MRSIVGKSQVCRLGMQTDAHRTFTEAFSVTESAPGEPIMFPQPDRLRHVGIMGSVIVVFLAVALLVSGNLGHYLIVGDVVLAVSCIGIARAGIRCDAKGVAVQGLTLSHRFTWAEIVKIENRELHGIGVVRRVDGWNQLVGPKVFGGLSEQTTQQLEQQRLLHQNS